MQELKKMYESKHTQIMYEKLTAEKRGQQSFIKRKRGDNSN